MVEAIKQSYVQHRQRSTYKNTPRIIWKSKSRFVS